MFVLRTTSMTKFSTLSLCIFLALTKDVFMQFKDLGEINCAVQAKDTKCGDTEACTAICSAVCNTPAKQPRMWGSRVYTSDSEICRAAVHDYRVPSYASDHKYSVTFKRRQKQTFAQFLPTIQQGIITIIYSTPDDYYTFLSPYFEEEILDVTILSYTNMYPENGDFRQECSINAKYRRNNDLDFQFYIPEKEKDIGIENEAGWKEVSWIGKQLHPGGYWCHVAGNTYSHAMSLTMRADADFIPDQWTLTASPKTSVLIRFTPRPNVNTELAIKWKKDEKDLYSFSNMKRSHDRYGHYLQIDNLDIGDGGIYSLELEGKPEKRGIMRLIVRRCPQGYFGSCCSQQCPKCQNGGVCHDVMGTCICAPGFAGLHCENKCMKNCFGQSCTQCCDRSSNTKDGSCRGAVICQPDPYGCSCADGYTGLKCDVNSELLDVVTLNYVSLYPPSGIFYQECFVNENKTCHDLTFEFYTSEIPEKKKGIANAAGGEEVSWMGSQLKPGGYWCRVAGNAFSHVMSLTMSSDADMVPEQWTKTVSVKDNVVIKFAPQHHLPGSRKTTWRKDKGKLDSESESRRKLSQDNSGYYLQINDIKITDGGIYSLAIDGSEAQKGIMRLIVRRCPKNMYGSSCNHQCPTCDNGGVCHDVTGACICAPGFTGPTCEHECTSGYFGKDCNHACFESHNTKFTSCKGALICLPDPYGCSCASGFTGLKCDKFSNFDSCCQSLEKASHYAGNQACNVKSDICPNSCREGWKSYGCSISYPYLFRSPSLVPRYSSSLDVEFPPWNGKQQPGDGNPASYMIQVKELSSRCNVWATKNSIPANSTSVPDKIVGTIEELKSGSSYAVRVVIQDEDGHSQSELAPIAVYNTKRRYRRHADEVADTFKKKSNSCPN